MELLADLDAFYLEHRRCGELEAEVIPEEEPSSSAARGECLVAKSNGVRSK
jgi:hypothetical protein